MLHWQRWSPRLRRSVLSCSGLADSHISKNQVGFLIQKPGRVLKIQFWKTFLWHVFKQNLFWKHVRRSHSSSTFPEAEKLFLLGSQFRCRTFSFVCVVWINYIVVYSLLYIFFAILPVNISNKHLTWTWGGEAMFKCFFAQGMRRMLCCYFLFILFFFDSRPSSMDTYDIVIFIRILKSYVLSLYVRLIGINRIVNRLNMNKAVDYKTESAMHLWS